MKTKLFIAAAAVLCLLSCRKLYTSPVPSIAGWDLFNSPAARSLSADILKHMNGVYAITTEGTPFGNEAAAKWSYTIKGTDTTYHLSFFCQKDITYFICEGKRLDSSILLNGYWRRMIGTETGKIQLTITSQQGAAYLFDTTSTSAKTILITGVYGNAEEAPQLPISLLHQRPLYEAAPMEIVAHRGGGRSADLLPASENSVEIIKMASRLGATGVEIDVRLTRDGVPILFHDATLNERLIQKNGMVGPIENYSYAQLNNLVKLVNGERIPTLREALNETVYNTPLRYVWLDTKFIGSMQILRDIQAEFIQKAAAIGRTITITIGIPDKQVLTQFKGLPGYKTIPSVNELTQQDVSDVNSMIWGPRFTLGLQNEEVSAEQAKGRRVFVWTLDVPENIREYIYNGRFNGILSNYPSAVAYYYYAKK